MEGLSQRCSEIFVKYKIVPEDERDIYVYGFELLFTTLFSTVSILAAGLFMKKIAEAFIFIAVFFVLRMFSGGYHADTHWGCFLITNAVFFVSTGLEEALRGFPVPVQIVLVLASAVFIWMFAPMVHPNQPLTPEKFSKNRKYTRICLFMAIIMAGLLYALAQARFASSVESAVIMVCMMMVIKQKRRKKYVEIT